MKSKWVKADNQAARTRKAKSSRQLTYTHTQIMPEKKNQFEKEICFEQFRMAQLIISKTNATTKQSEIGQAQNKM